MRAMKAEKPKQEIPGCGKGLCILAGIIFAGAEVVGGVVYRTGSVGSLFSSGRSFLFSILLFLLAACVSAAVFALLTEAAWRIQSRESSKAGRLGRITDLLFGRKYSWMILSVLIFLSILICYLAYYPGIFSYDMPEQTAMALGTSPITRFHPPLHTYFWKFCLKMEQLLPIRAIVLGTILQMLFMTAVLTHALLWMARRGVRSWILILSLLFYLLNPVISIFCIVNAKDIPFAGFFLLFMIRFAQLLSDRETFLRSPAAMLGLSADILLCCLLRNNAMYALLLMVPVSALLPGEKRWAAAGLFAAPILLYLIINGPIYTVLGVEEGNVREMYSVPIQQISRVAAREGDSLEEEIRQEIKQYLKYKTVREKYNPRFADPVKRTFRTERYEEDKAGFFRLWFKLFLRYPGHYADAFLDLNIPYWYPGADPIDPYSQRSYIETKIHPSQDYTFERAGYLPGLYAYYESAANYSLLRKIPVISVVDSLYFPIWALLGGSFFIIAFYRRRKKEAAGTHKNRKEMYKAVLFLPAILFWLTYLIGPVSNARYVFPIMLMYPLIAAAALQPAQIVGLDGERSE